MEERTWDMSWTWADDDESAKRKLTEFHSSFMWGFVTDIPKATFLRLRNPYGPKPHDYNEYCIQVTIDPSRPFNKDDFERKMKDIIFIEGEGHVRGGAQAQVISPGFENHQFEFA